jgi:hypothetical protein
MPHEKTATNTTSFPLNSSLMEQDLRIHEVISMFGSNPQMMPILAELTKKSEGLSATGSRVGTLTAKVLPEGQLEIRFVSRWPIIDK